MLEAGTVNVLEQAGLAGSVCYPMPSMPELFYDHVTPGDSIEKMIAPLSSFISEPMQYYGKLFLRTKVSSIGSCAIAISAGLSANTSRYGI